MFNCTIFMALDKYSYFLHGIAVFRDGNLPTCDHTADKLVKLHFPDCKVCAVTQRISTSFTLGSSCPSNNLYPQQLALRMRPEGFSTGSTLIGKLGRSPICISSALGSAIVLASYTQYIPVLALVQGCCHC